MLGIDIALLVGGGLLLVCAAGWLGGKLGTPSEAARRRAQGERNAAAEKLRREESCTVCGASIDPAHDVLDAGRWWHTRCYRELLNEDKPR